MGDDTILKEVGVGENAPRVVNVIIEISKHSSIKYEIDKKTGLLKLDRMLFSSDYYPGDYGMIPQTLCGDGDPLDVVVITDKELLPRTIAEVRVIGVARMIDSGEKDDKILGVYDKDPRFKEYRDIKDIPDHVLKEIENFFETYKKLQGKKCKITKIQRKSAALKAIKEAQEMYKKEISKKNQTISLNSQQAKRDRFSRVALP